ncbi:MAG: hypothetical protein ACREQ5_30985 [Candidatus Dormibacteria bacterium]
MMLDLEKLTPEEISALDQYAQAKALAQVMAEQIAVSLEIRETRTSYIQKKITLLRDGSFDARADAMATRAELENAIERGRMLRDVRSCLQSLLRSTA